MRSRISRRKLIQATLLAGAGLDAALVAQSSTRPNPVPGGNEAAVADPYADRLRRFGGELGGTKAQP
ncbi:MAG: hypothetical protein ACRETU_03600 [Steroidobacterales bacterium]